MADDDEQWGTIEPEEYFRRLDAEYDELTRDTTESIVQFHHRLRDLYGYGPSLDCYAATCHLALEAAQLAEDDFWCAHPEDSPDGAWYGVLRSLFARALRAANEIHHLLTGGFVHGAVARMRSLYELAVFATIIHNEAAADGPHPELVERYIAHSEILARNEAQSLFYLMEIGDSNDILDQETVDRFVDQKREYSEHYGASFLSQFGWAAPLFNKPRFSFFDLQKAAGMEEIAYLYHNSCHEVHADSAGWESSYCDCESPELITGAKTDGFEWPFGFSLFLLQHVLRTVVEVEDVDERKRGLILDAVERYASRAQSLLNNRKEDVDTLKTHAGCCNTAHHDTIQE